MSKPPANAPAIQWIAASPAYASVLLPRAAVTADPHKKALHIRDNIPAVPGRSSDAPRSIRSLARPLRQVNYLCPRCRETDLPGRAGTESG